MGRLRHTTAIPRVGCALDVPCAAKAGPRPAFVFLLVFAVALIVRLVYLAQMNASPIFHLLMGDARQYDLWAKSILREGWLGHEVFYQAPLYPYFLAVVYRVFGEGPGVVRLLQTIAGAAACGLLFCAGRRLFSWRAGLTAGLLLAFYPPAIFYTGLLQKPAIDLVLMVLLLWLLSRLDEKWRSSDAVWMGLVVGLLALTRENALVLILLLLAWVALRFGSTRRGQWARRDLVVIAGLALVLLPVGLRNQMIGGTFLPTTAQFGPNFYMGNNPHANGLCQPLRAWRSGPEYERQDAIDLAENAMGRKLSPAEVSHYWFNKAAEFIRTEPGAWLRLLARKWWLTWNAREVMDTDNIEVYYEQSRVLRVLGCVLHFGVLAPLAMLGAWLTRREWRRLWVLYGTVGLLVASSAVFFVFARYRFPVVPVLALFAGAGIVELLRILRARQGRTLVLAVLLTTATAVAANWPVDIGEQLATSHYNFGAAFRRQGRTPEAIDQYRRALQVEPTHVMALNNLAWILATDTQDAIRDGAQAVLLGRRACEATGWADPAALDTLAAAYAQSGDFTRAVETLRMGLKKAVSGGDAAAISQIQAHLAEFQAGRALRVEPPTIAAR